MIPRYSRPEMAALFTEEAKFAAWLEVEILACEAWAELGVVPSADAAIAIRERAGFDVAAIDERERVTDHDMAAFVDVVQERVGLPAGAWVHYGLTSSDVVDTALCSQLTKACDLMIDALDGARCSRHGPCARVPRHPMVGRTHGIHAEPTTFGAKLALWALQIRRRSRTARPRPRARSRSASSRAQSARTPTSIPRVEDHVCAALGLVPVPATQVIARDRHAESALRVRVSRREHRVVRPRDPAPPAHRGRRGRRAVPRRAEGLERDAAQAQPREVRAAVRPGPRAAFQPASRIRGCRVVARARHLALVGRTHHPSRLAPARALRRHHLHHRRAGHDGVVGADAREPRRFVRARVQPAGIARARRERDEPRPRPTASCSATR